MEPLNHTLGIQRSLQKTAAGGRAMAKDGAAAIGQAIGEDGMEVGISRLLRTAGLVSGQGSVSVELPDILPEGLSILEGRIPS